jgi:hypothetical protein
MVETELWQDVESQRSLLVDHLVGTVEDDEISGLLETKMRTPCNVICTTKTIVLKMEIMVSEKINMERMVKTKL